MSAAGGGSGGAAGDGAGGAGGAAPGGAWPEVRPGDRFLVAAPDYVAGVLTQWMAPFTGGSRRPIPRGTVLVALDPVEETAPGFGCRPEEYDRLLHVLVDEEDRREPKFAGYYVSCLKADVGGALERLGPA